MRTDRQCWDAASRLGRLSREMCSLHLKVANKQGCHKMSARSYSNDHARKATHLEFDSLFLLIPCKHLLHLCNVLSDTWRRCRHRNHCRERKVSPSDFLQVKPFHTVELLMADYSRQKSLLCVQQSVGVNIGALDTQRHALITYATAKRTILVKDSA